MAGDDSGRGDDHDGLSRRRDAGLAAVTAVGVLAATTVAVGDATEADPGVVVAFLARPVPLAAGVAGAVLLELGFALAPRHGRALWRRRSVRLAGTATVAVGLPAVALARPAVAGSVLAALSGGLVGYAALLAGVATGVLPSPETWFGRDREPETE
ncbi:hypothetical protein [Halobaculum sp. MBLA0143]|uniref:hypothetical protein n=1 Tax=Halobaculum sp. MBLA0143 TaxID=3079933 RepID=UPI0035262306